MLPGVDVPPGWQVLEQLEARQMTAPAVFGVPDPAAVPLTADDRDDIQSVFEQADGNIVFEPRGFELGSFVGIREGDRLVAVGGERFHGPGWTELSGGCVVRDRRGRGYGSRLLRHRAAAVEARRELPVLHVFEGNPAAEFFLALGWQNHASVAAVELRAPDGKRVE
jgi:GNAT superfamily N-acetyltransferase